MSEQPSTVDVAANVRAELGRQRMTYRDFAKRLQGRSALTEQTVRDRLTGRTRFRADELPPIADVLGVPVSVLLGEEARAS